MTTSIPTLNLALIHGTLSSEPRVRQLPSGDQLVQLEVTTAASPRALTVPVAWIPTGPAPTLTAGSEVLVYGSVSRRWFRAGGASVSRTEVVAERVIPATRAREVRRLLERVKRLVEAG